LVAVLQEFKTTIELQKTNRFDVTLVSDRDYLYVYPMSICVPVHVAEFEDVKLPLANIQKKYPFKLIIDTVKDIRATENQVVCQNISLTYD